MNLTPGTPLHTLAAEGSPALWLLVIGVPVVLLLLGAFWYGSKRAERHRANLPQEPQPGADSWQTPDESTGRDEHGGPGSR
ncbi:DUF6479 family protein [Streptomyces sp. NBC_00237]|uniref:DUF6479 family protein n=1 Tax=Streptomyces sp. NBC_00237 TaxID=2975687 RepID=UPI00225B598F|nr:DUF6479 family protein [Streptomyces sp. NBC_00237]MCX5206442.1 DUF6479 family protein [Streptomyces sp. NBC_00237]